MEGRMTMCNMSIEGGARAGMVAPDETTFKDIKGRPHAPRVKRDKAVEYWKTLPTDEGAVFDKEIFINADELRAPRHLGYQPRPGCAAEPVCAVPRRLEDENDKVAATRALEYMGLEAGTP